MISSSHYDVHGGQAANDAWRVAGRQKRRKSSSSTGDARDLCADVAFQPNECQGRSRCMSLGTRQANVAQLRRTSRGFQKFEGNIDCQHRRRSAEQRLPTGASGAITITEDGSAESAEGADTARRLTEPRSEM